MFLPPHSNLVLLRATTSQLVGSLSHYTPLGTLLATLGTNWRWPSGLLAWTVLRLMVLFGYFELGTFCNPSESFSLRYIVLSGHIVLYPTITYKILWYLQSFHHEEYISLCKLKNNKFGLWLMLNFDNAELSRLWSIFQATWRQPTALHVQGIFYLLTSSLSP